MHLLLLLIAAMLATRGAGGPMGQGSGAKSALPALTTIPFQPPFQPLFQPSQAGRSPQELFDIAAPVALLPDPLLAEVLAASNFSTQITRARRFMNSQGLNSAGRQLRWPDSVRVLTQAPEFFNNLATHRDWLLALNQALRVQPRDLFAAIQSLRQRAWESGALRGVQGVRIVRAAGVIRIEPADSDFIPIPCYAPAVVFAQEAPPQAITMAGSIPTSSIGERLDLNWTTGELVYGWGGWFQGEIGRDRAGNISASGTTFVLGSRPGYEGVPWRPSGTVVFPGSVSTQGSPLEIAPWVPPVAPSQPLMPAGPMTPRQPLNPTSVRAPHAPVQPATVRGPVQPMRPVAPIPSNIPGVYAPLPLGDDQLLLGGWGGWGGWAGGGSIFGPAGGWAAGQRGASSATGSNR
jgi:hypothetical protein